MKAGRLRYYGLHSKGEEVKLLPCCTLKYPQKAAHPKASKLTNFHAGLPEGHRRRGDGERRRRGEKEKGRGDAGVKLSV